MMIIIKRNKNIRVAMLLWFFYDDDAGGGGGMYKSEKKLSQ